MTRSCTASSTARLNLRLMGTSDLHANVFSYDYYRDNCSTRVRDALDLALGGAIRRTLVGVPTGPTYRSHTRRLVVHQLADHLLRLHAQMGRVTAAVCARVRATGSTLRVRTTFDPMQRVSEAASTT